MASAPIDIPVKIKGLSDLQKLERKMEQLEKDLAKVARTGPKAANAIKKTGRAAATASGNVQRLGIAFRTTLAPVVAITGALALFNKALRTTGEREAEVNVLSIGLRGLVNDSSAAATELLKVADQLGKDTLFDEEDFVAQFKLFTSFRNIGVDSYERVGEAAADIATKLGTGPKEAALQLAKALEDPAKQVTALARSGTVFTEQQKEQIKTLQESGDLLGAQEIILSEIEKQYGGAAKAAGQSGFAGAVDTLGESWRDLLEALGKSSDSGVAKFINGISEGLQVLTKNFDVVAEVAQSVIDVFVQPFVALAEEIGKVLPKVDNFEQSFRGTLAVISKILTDLTNNILKPVFRFIGFITGKIIQFVGNVGKAVATIVSGIVKTVTGGIRILAKAIETFINNTPLGLLSKLFGLDAGAFATGGLQNLANGIEGLASSVNGYGDALRNAAAAANLPQPGDQVGGDPFAGAGPRGANAAASGGGAGGAGNSTATAKSLADEAQRRAAAMAAGLKSAQGMLRAALDEQSLLQTTTDVERIRTQGAIDLANISIKYADAAEEAKSAAEVDVLVKAQALEVSNKQLEVAEQLKKLNDDQTKDVKEIDELYKSIGSTLSSSISSAIDGLIEGTADWNSLLRSTLKDLSKVLLNFGLSALGKSAGAGSLLGNLFGGFRANGGPVSSGTPYVVGEKGPELFVPGRNGAIVPNGASAGGSTVVNITVNAGGGGSSSSQGEKAKEAAQLGRMVEASVVSIINREKRPGGILTR